MNQNLNTPTCSIRILDTTNMRIMPSQNILLFVVKNQPKSLKFKNLDQYKKENPQTHSSHNKLLLKVNS